MNRPRRLAVIAAAVVASLAGSAVAATAHSSDATEYQQRSGENTHGDWWCVYVDRPVDAGVCQGNPLPKRLPLPEDRPRV